MKIQMKQIFSLINFKQWNIKTSLFLLVLLSLLIFTAELISKPKIQEDVDLYFSYGLVSDLKYSPDEKILATRGEAGLLFWDMESKKLISNIVDSLGFSFFEWIDNQKLVYLTSNDERKLRTIDIFNSNVIREQYFAYGTNTGTINLSPDRQKFLIITNRDSILIFDISSGDTLVKISSNAYFNVTCWSPDGEKIAGRIIINDPYSSYYLRIYDFINSKQITSKYKFRTPSNKLVWSDNGEFLATIENDSLVMVFDPDNLNVIKQIKLNSKILDLEISANGNYIYCALQDKRLIKIDLNDLDNHKVISDDSYGRIIRLDKNYSKITYIGENKVIIRDLSDGIIKDTLGKYYAVPGSEMQPKAYWSPDGSKIASNEPDRNYFGKSKIKLWDAYTGIFLREMSLSRSQEIAWGPDGDFIASADDSPSGGGWSFLKIIDTLLFASDHISTYNCEVVETISWNIHNSKIAVAGKSAYPKEDSYTISIFSFNKSKPNLKELSNINVSNSDISKVLWSPDGTKLATLDKGYDKSKLRILDPVTGNVILIREPRRIYPESNKYRFCWAPDSKHIAYFISYDSINIMDIETGSEISVAAPFYSSSLAWSPDGKMLAVGGSYFWMIYNTSNWNIIKKYYTYFNNQFTSLSWSPDSKNIVFTCGFGLIISFKPDLSGLDIEEKPYKKFEIFSISPNPASEYIEIKFDNVILSEAKNLIKIYNTIGECLMTVGAYCDTPLHRIDISHFPVGLYFIQIGNYSQKFVVVR